MASILEPEVQLAQRLASNEKPIRTKAIKKLRKYISVRSQRIKGCFTEDELLKLWKGLFYCLWMQDKPLLQEELSNQIAGLLHRFQNVDSQFLYLETFLQTIKREWTGIDRLRMDKFLQLVRFVIRQSFEMLKRRRWETSVVARFLDLLSAQVLVSTSAAPCGLQFHILDLYMTELSGVGSAELTAEQNLTFIEPFCKSAAKTKDRILLKAICSSIFSAIIDQAPFAIEDLMKEIKKRGAEDTDSGQASEEEEDEEEQNTNNKPAGQKALQKSTIKQMNGTTTTEDTDEDDDEEDELLHLEDGSDTELPEDEGIGPVLQFDYGALADKLFQLASRKNTPSLNRQKLYKVITALRDLSEGVFPQDEYPEEVSTDEDDDEMFGSRKRMKRARGRGDKEEEGPAAKKCKDELKDAGQPGSSAAEQPVDTKSDSTSLKKKKKRKKKRRGKETSKHAEEQTHEVEQLKDQACVTTSDKTDVEKVGPSILNSSEIKSEALAPLQSTEAGFTMDTQSETPLATTIVVGSQSSVTVSVAASHSEPVVAEGNEEDQLETTAIKEEPLNKSDTVDDPTASSKKKKKRKGSDQKLEKFGPGVEFAEDQPGTQQQDIPEQAVEPQTGPKTPTTITPGGKKRKRKTNKQRESMEKTVEVEEGLEANLKSVTSAEEPLIVSSNGTPLKKTRKRKARKQKLELTQDESSETYVTPAETSRDIEAHETPTEEPTSGVAASKKRKKLKVSKANDQMAEELGEIQQESEAICTEGQVTAPTQILKTRKQKSKPLSLEEAEGQTQPDLVESCSDELPTENEPLTPLKKGKKKRKIPVVIEVEAEELDAARLAEGEEAAGKMNDESEEPTTPVSSKKLRLKAKAGSGNNFITFQNDATIPTPIFYKAAKGGSSKKKCQTPKSDSKKVTFGLKNNKTAEFRKNDRSLLLSPEGPSRVPFDPQQKPLFGVLKSPVSLLSGSTKKTSKSIPKGRPTAADFF